MIGLKLSRIGLTTVILLMMLFGIPTVHAQTPGYADITYPLDGTIIHDIVTVEGSAFHPLFSSYELSFAYPEDPTDTWFEIVAPVETPVREGSLGIWDTSGLSEGEYRLRLRVHLENGTVISTFREGILVSETDPGKTPTPQREAPAGVNATQPYPTPTATPRPTPIQLEDVDAWGDSVGKLRTGFIIGIILTGIYLSARRQLQAYWGSMRMRQIHRETSRRQRK
jgi:hypothetical protein